MSTANLPRYHGFLGNKYPNLLERIQRLNNPILNDLYYQVRRMTKLNLEAEQYVFDFLRAAQTSPSADANAVAELRDQLSGLYYYNCLEPASEDYSDICMSCGYYTDSREAPLESPAFQNTLLLIRAEADYLMETLKGTYERYLD